MAKVWWTTSLLDLDFPGLEISNFHGIPGKWAWSHGDGIPLPPGAGKAPSNLWGHLSESLQSYDYLMGWVLGVYPVSWGIFLIPSKNEKHISNEFNCFKKTGLKLLFYNSLEIASPEIKQETNKNSTIKDTPKTGWCFFTNPFETYAKVKLDHFPR